MPISAEEASGDLLKSLHTALQSVIALKLEAPLGASLDQAKPRRAENWRSELSLAGIRANLETADALYAGPGGFSTALQALTDEDQLDWTMRQDFTQAFAQLDAIGLPLDAAVEDPPRAPRSRRCSPRSRACASSSARSWRRRSTCWSASMPWMGTDGGTQEDRARRPPT